MFIMRHYYSWIKYHGFHCENPEHVAKVHTLIDLDANMHYSCCAPFFLNDNEGTVESQVDGVTDEDNASH